MMSVATLHPEPAPILACTVARDVQDFEALIDAMEAELGESWGDLDPEDALIFLGQADAAALQFLVLALDAREESRLALYEQLITKATARELKVIVIADHISPVSLHRLLRLGASDFLPWPLAPGAFPDALARLRAPTQRLEAVPADQPAHQPAPEAGEDEITQAPSAPRPTLAAPGGKQGILLPVHGMAGGSGASTFATNLAWELATLEKTGGPRVCLIDLDFQYGSIATYLDLPRREAVFELLTDPSQADAEQLMQAMQTFGDRLAVFTAPLDMLPLDIITGEDLGHLIDLALQQFDYVVVDMPTTVVSWTEAILSRATAYFALMELDLRSAQNVLRFLRALKAEGLPHEKLRHVLNRAPRFTDLSAKSRVKRMAESLDIQIEIQLPDGGAPVTQANDHGLPLGETAAKNPLRKEMAKLARSLHDTSRATATATATAKA